MSSQIGLAVVGAGMFLLFVVCGSSLLDAISMEVTT
jgi:hypothetical protein